MKNERYQRGLNNCKDDTASITHDMNKENQNRLDPLDNMVLFRHLMIEFAYGIMV